MNKLTRFVLLIAVFSVTFTGSTLFAQTSPSLTPPGVQTSKTTVKSYTVEDTNPSKQKKIFPKLRPANRTKSETKYPIQQVAGEIELPGPPLQDPLPAPPSDTVTETTPDVTAAPEVPVVQDGSTTPSSEPQDLNLSEPIPNPIDTAPTTENPVAESPVVEPTAIPSDPQPNNDPTLNEVPNLPIENTTPNNVELNAPNTGEPRVFNAPQTLPVVGGLPPRTDQSNAQPNQVAIFSTGTGEPGAKALNGPQSPLIIVEKIPPKELLVGQRAIWKTVVKNVGQSIAVGVEIRDQLPKGTQLIETTPQAVKGINGDLIWKIGDIPPGKQTVVSMELLPIEEGRIGSVAQVSFITDASAEGIVAKPLLAIQTQGVKEINIGNTTELKITISNPGTGIAKNVILTENVPPQLQHEAKDSVLTNEIGDIKPGESKTITLQMTAIRAGKFFNSVTAKAEPTLNVESRFEMEVIAPQLKMTVQGPTRRFLEREGAYKISVHNPGTAPAKSIAMSIKLPAGLEFVRANNQGVYDRQTRTVRWLLEQLAPNDSADAELVITPTQIGQQTLVYQATAERGVTDNGQKECQVEGMAALLTQVSDTNDPVLVGERTVYNINVINQGSKASQNVRVTAQIPQGMEFINAEGPTRYQLGPNNTVIFEVAPMLSPKAEIKFKILVKGVSPGDQRLKVSVMSNELATPVTKEESTQVYQDQM